MGYGPVAQPLPNRYFLKNGLMRRMLLAMMQKMMTSRPMATDRVVSMTKLWRFALKKRAHGREVGQEEKVQQVYVQRAAADVLQRAA